MYVNTVLGLEGLSRIRGVFVYVFGQDLVGMLNFYKSTLVNDGCTSEQDNKDK